MIENFVKIYDNVIDEKSCKGLIEKFETSQDKYETVNIADKEDRISFKQIVLVRNEEWKAINDGMMTLFQAYIEQYKKECNISTKMWPEKHGYEAIRMKRYLANDYDRFDYHVDVKDYATARRFLAFFIYLNDVEEGGETEFLMDNIMFGKVQPKMGRLIMFPPMWPWFHAGLKPVSGTKYFIHSYCHYI